MTASSEILQPFERKNKTNAEYENSLSPELTDVTTSLSSLTNETTPTTIETGLRSFAQDPSTENNISAINPTNTENKDTLIERAMRDSYDIIKNDPELMERLHSNTQTEQPTDMDKLNTSPATIAEMKRLSGPYTDKLPHQDTLIQPSPSSIEDTDFPKNSEKIHLKGDTTVAVGMNDEEDKTVKIEAKNYKQIDKDIPNTDSKDVQQSLDTSIEKNTEALETEGEYTAADEERDRAVFTDKYLKEYQANNPMPTDPDSAAYKYYEMQAKTYAEHMANAEINKKKIIDERDDQQHTKEHARTLINNALEALRKNNNFDNLSTEEKLKLIMNELNNKNGAEKSNENDLPLILEILTIILSSIARGTTDAAMQRK